MHLLRHFLSFLERKVCHCLFQICKRNSTDSKYQNSRVLFVCQTWLNYAPRSTRHGRKFLRNMCLPWPSSRIETDKVLGLTLIWTLIARNIKYERHHTNPLFWFIANPVMLSAKWKLFRRFFSFELLDQGCTLGFFDLVLEMNEPSQKKRNNGWFWWSWVDT